tara:strand:+ start:211 stop:519 length:309 start_codon:yes stop_codon:yes gene_type:complete
MEAQIIKQWMKENNYTCYGDKVVLAIEQCFNDLQPQWVKLGNGPEESCNVWANHMGMVRIIDFYRCPEYGNVFWSYDGEDIDDIDFTHYMVIKQPLPPSEGE